MTNKKFLDDHYYNKVLFESKNFIVIPSLGSLVEGWLLIVPKDHYLSFGSINNKDLYSELTDLIGYLDGIVKSEYGDYMIFEHGPNCQGTLVGCGVDYAHVHIVPYPINLIQECEKDTELNFDWHRVNGIQDAAGYARENLPYLFYSNNNENYIATSNKIPSQLFRKIISQNLGLDLMWDWKLYPFKENLINTVDRLSKYSVEISLPENYAIQ